MLLRTRTLLGGYKSARNLLRSLFLPLKSYKRAILLAISRQIRICET
ncbi:hypothetical protein T06_15948 [Trichinella sp. T6]|nr:hypothetical protein T06_15948 [Trichinella sp. T6]